MISSHFAEDIFVEFEFLVAQGRIDVQNNDFAPIISLADRLSRGEEITQNQANYIIKLLEKYKNVAAATGVDYKSKLVNPQWKKPFRVLDLTKKIYVEKTDAGTLEVCVKFPFQLKAEFDKEIKATNSNNIVGHWDSENKVRRLNFFDANLISLNDFALKHSFEIDESFLELLSEVEEIWQNAEEYAPCSVRIGRDVHLVNASNETEEYFQANKTGNVFDDLLLAKQMGYPAKDLPNMTRYNMVSSSENSFWLKENRQFFSIYKEISGNICVILDRTSDVLPWLQQFVADADISGVSRDEIRVCFRENKDSNKGLNEWVKLAGVGGKVDSGRIFIFESKPAKWLFKNFKDVKLVVTNSLYPATNNITKELFSSFPCVIYLGDIKATNAKGQKIVEL